MILAAFFFSKKFIDRRKKQRWFAKSTKYSDFKFFLKKRPFGKKTYFIIFSSNFFINFSSK